MLWHSISGALGDGARAGKCRLGAGADAVYGLCGLVWLASKTDDLVPDDPNSEDVELPEIAEIYKAGLYYLLPIVVLVYFLMIEQKSPGLSAFWATSLLFVILLTQRPLKAMFRNAGDYGEKVKLGVMDLIAGLIEGARNMIGIGLATATAGIIVGTVTLTGIGQVMADLVELVSGGNLILMLVFVGVLSLILGMGLPTTANYIVVSSLMAGVVVELGAQSGLIVPLIAVHLFVFYFGIMADVTPPGGAGEFRGRRRFGWRCDPHGLYRVLLFAAHSGPAVLLYLQHRFVAD